MEPWRHGIPVYGYPFPMNDDAPSAGVDTDANADVDTTTHTDTNIPNASSRTTRATTTTTTTNRDGAEVCTPSPNISSTGILREGNYSQQQHNDNHNNPRDGDRPNPPSFYTRTRQMQNTNTNTNTSTIQPPPAPAPRNTETRTNVIPEAIPIRRVRHSEVVLVDEVSVHFNKYWLRLLWPGSRGGVAGYIVLGGTNSVPNDRVREWKERLRGAVGGIELEGFEVGGMNMNMGMNDGDESGGIGIGIPPDADTGSGGASVLNHESSTSAPEGELVSS